MTITRPKTKAPASLPLVDEAAAGAFISGAPDSPQSTKTPGVKKGNRQQISLTITPNLLLKVDELAEQLGQSRAAVINMAIYRIVEQGLDIAGLNKR